MPTNTPNLGLPRPVGSDLVTRANHNALVDAIDSSAEALAVAQRPFNLLSAVYDNPNNRLVVTLGAGRAAFLNAIVNLTGNSTVYIAAPAINTTYYVYLKSDGSFTSNLTGSAVTGAVLLWQVITGATLSTLSWGDLRGELPGASGRVVQDALSTHQTASPIDHPDGSVTTQKLAPGAATGTALGGDVVKVGTTAGGSLAGTYPNPGLAAGAATGSALGSDVIKVGTAAGGSLSGSYPNPSLATGAATGAALGADVIKTSTGAGGDLTGTYPSPTVGAAKITNSKIAPNAVSSDKTALTVAASGGVSPVSVTSRDPSYTNILSISLTLPAAGNVIVTGAVSFDVSNATSNRLIVRITDTTSGNDVAVHEFLASATNRWSFQLSKILTGVPAGARTYTLRAAWLGTGSESAAVVNDGRWTYLEALVAS